MRSALFLCLLLGLAGCAIDENGGADQPPADAGPDLQVDTTQDAEEDAAPRDMGGGDAGTGDTALDAAPDTAPDVPLECDEGTPCGQTCAMLDSDPANCGACGRTCVVPNAQAGCQAGECTLGECLEGYFDQDGDLTNGCELEDTCLPGQACTTSCGSMSTTDCADGETLCLPPAEVCNASDDNCDGACDEGALDGCRLGVHRAYGEGHLYTANLNTAQTAPFRLESQNYFWIYAQPVASTRPMFRCRKGNGKFLLTSDTACERMGGRVEQLGFWAPQEACGAVPLYGLHLASSDNHFYTLSAAERDRAVAELGYVSRGIAGWVWGAP